MLSLGWSEITILIVLVIIVVGPNEIPNLLKQLGYFSKKLKSISKEFNANLNNLAKEAEIDKIQKDIKKISSFDPKKEILKKSEIESQFKDINQSFNKLDKEVKNMEKEIKDESK